MPKQASTLDVADAKKWRALCAYLTDHGWRNDQLDPIDIAVCAVEVWRMDERPRYDAGLPNKTEADDAA
jgi:hypothetical protein